MFFVPSIVTLQDEFGSGRRKHDHDEIWLLCLTTGDYDGLGKTRTKELYQNTLQFDKILLCHHEQIQDHPHHAWDPNLSMG